MSDIFEQPDDAATPLTPDEKAGLIADYVATRHDLNRAEQRNIIKGQSWAFARKRDVLDVIFLRELHKRMFGDVWSWAGTFRTSARNIGIDAHHIAPALLALIGDTKSQIDHASYSGDEIAGRFHHRLVAIHPFPNGNGRHGRLATDLLAVQLGLVAFDWGAPDALTSATAMRQRYVAALKGLDAGDVAPLLHYMRPAPPAAQ